MHFETCKSSVVAVSKRTKLSSIRQVLSSVPEFFNAGNKNRIIVLLNFYVAQRPCQIGLQEAVKIHFRPTFQRFLANQGLLGKALEFKI